MVFAILCLMQLLFAGSPPVVVPGTGPVVDTLPDGFPEVVIETEPGVSDGRLYMSPVVGSAFKLVVLENSGEVVSYLEDQPITRYLNFGPYGSESLFYHVDPPGVESVFVVTDSLYNVQDTFRAGPGQIADSHDILFLDNGHALVLVYDRRPVDMSEIVAGGNPNAMVTGLIIQEVDHQRNVFWEWRSWDHFAITDGITQSANAFIDFTGVNISYIHANSLDLDFDGNIILSSRNMHEVTKIDRSSGEIIWRMGGKNNQFTFINDTLGFTDQHDARMVAPGRITVFDNGNFHDPPQSRVVEYVLDEEQMTAQLVWSFDNPYGVRSVGSGNAQRLDNGNTLIGWGIIDPVDAPVVTEVTPDGAIVLEGSFFDGQNYAVQYSYRWLRGQPQVQTSVAQERLAQIAIFPNPASHNIYIVGRYQHQTIDHLALYDRNGRLVSTGVSIDLNRAEIACAGITPGVYWVEVRFGSQIERQSVVISGH